MLNWTYVPDSDSDLEAVEETFAWVAAELFQAGSVESTLQRVVDLAGLAVSSCDGAGLMMLSDSGPTTAAASSELMREFDAAQISAGQGPCVDAVASGKTFYAYDLADDDRWPDLAPIAMRLGIRSVLALAIASVRPSALNMCAELPSAFGSVDRAQGVMFATLARHAIDTAEGRAAEDEQTVNLNEALRSRELIGQAQGVLMERERITPEQAFDVLRRASQHLNVKLRVVAQRLVDTGETPEMTA